MFASVHPTGRSCLAEQPRSLQRPFVSSSNSVRKQRCGAVRTAAASRRESLLQTSLIASWLAAGPSLADVCSTQDTLAEADACRSAELSRGTTGDYSKISVGTKKSLAPNVPVSDLNSEYATSTRDLAAKIDKYLTLDVYDKSRQPLIKSLKTDGSTWVSKYARGGSARTQSARNMYIAVDAVQGYLASNGLAPMPASKARVVSETLNKALAFLQEGK